MFEKINSKASDFAVWFSSKLFTWQSLTVHIYIYTAAWFIESGDHHLFLDCISIEAVMVTLLVGMATKRAEEHREKLAKMDRARDQKDLETDQSTNELVKLQNQELEALSQLTKEIHTIAADLHKIAKP